ncbi:MAG: hypothetical protein ACHREM_14845 [Polyangiales bacterium]
MPNPAANLSERISTAHPKLKSSAFRLVATVLATSSRTNLKASDRAVKRLVLAEARTVVSRIPRDVRELIETIALQVRVVRHRRTERKTVGDPLCRPFAQRIPEVRAARAQRLNKQMWDWMEANTE